MPIHPKIRNPSCKYHKWDFHLNCLILSIYVFHFEVLDVGFFYGICNCLQIWNPFHKNHINEFFHHVLGCEIFGGFFSSRSLKTREKYTNWDNLVYLSLYIFLSTEPSMFTFTKYFLLYRWLCAQKIYKLRQTKLSQFVYFSLVLRERDETKTKYSAPK